MICPCRIDDGVETISYRLRGGGFSESLGNRVMGYTGWGCTLAKGGEAGALVQSVLTGGQGGNAIR